MFIRTLPPRTPRRQFVATNLCVVVFYYERWRSLSVPARPRHRLHSWHRLLLAWPGYNFTQLGFPTKEKKPALALCAIPERALKPLGPTCSHHVVSRAVKGTDSCGNQGIINPLWSPHPPPQTPQNARGAASTQTGPPATRPDAGSMRCAGEELVGIHSRSSTGAKRRHFSSRRWCWRRIKEGAASLTKDLESQAGGYSHLAFPMD